MRQASVQGPATKMKGHVSSSISSTAAGPSMVVVSPLKYWNGLLLTKLLDETSLFETYALVGHYLTSNHTPNQVPISIPSPLNYFIIQGVGN